MFILIGQTLSVTRKSCDINTPPPHPHPPIVKARDNRIVFFFSFPRVFKHYYSYSLVILHCSASPLNEHT